MSAQQHKVGAPVVGFNHNLNYKGRVFHVQTEDSGPQHGHIITHLFMGGNIFASTKSSYADRLPGLDVSESFGVVRKLMEEQHKAMMKALLGGHHDAEISRRTGGPIYEPGVLAGGERAPGLLVGGDMAPAPAPQMVPAPPPPPAPRAPIAPARPAPMASSLSSTPRPHSGAQRPLATGLAPSPPVMVPGAISMVTPVPPPRAPVAARPSQPPARPPHVVSDPTGFGDNSFGSKTLDEVILNYLASDVDGPSR